MMKLFKQTFNTLLDAFSVSRKMIVSDYVKLNAAGFMPERVCGGSVYKVYEPRCKHFTQKQRTVYEMVKAKLAKT